MSPDKYTLLSTRGLSSNIIEAAALKNVLIDEVEFITTKPITDNETVSAIKKYFQRKCTVIFTSMNAVEAVAVNLRSGVDWKIYCMGNTTKDLVHKYFGDMIAGTGHDASDLANVIMTNNETDVIFFCSNQRRDELPDILHKNKVSIKELVVYHTFSLDKKVSNHYNGILFYSPSAVVSFFKNNTINAKTILFAIGETTANAITQYTSNQIIISDQAGKDKLVEKAIYFYNNNTTVKERN